VTLLRYEVKHMLRRTRAFTLIELLVVIAIIGILAAMLFPVFARARESARKIQCLSNVKNIALAFQMYLTDYDRFPPYLTDSAYDSVHDLLFTANGYRGDMCQFRAFQSNPYLRWPVILDEYVKNRDVWNCPSAKWMEGFDIVWDPGGVNGWARWMSEHPMTGWDGEYLYHPCMSYFPTGWGGTITDSVTQFVEVSYLGGGYTQAQGTFGGSIGVTEDENMDVSTSRINDPAKFVVCGDSTSPQMWAPNLDVWQACTLYYGGCADWENCNWSQDCGVSPSIFKQFWTSPSFRSKYTRHLGGSNFGFADGHAKWFLADAFLADVPHQDCPDGAWHEGTIEGAGSYDNIVACPTW
jgi:prepilin-type N-terminal cleavage/methylation domain-containing protein/prepilin-type processing-associated H-X9-DG protein